MQWQLRQGTLLSLQQPAVAIATHSPMPLFILLCCVGVKIKPDASPTIGGAWMQSQLLYMAVVYVFTLHHCITSLCRLFVPHFIDAHALAE